MLKLLIVDDEPYTRRGLLHFDWAKYGIEVAGEADDGLSALEQAKRLKPDLVLTDVRMPDMDGLEMIRRIREMHLHIKFIIMSAYNEIDYVKSALKLGAQDYILKPIDMGELALAVRKATRLIGHETAEKNLIQKMSGKLMQSMPALREKFLTALVCGGVEGQANLAERIRFLELSLSGNGTFCVFVVHDDSRAPDGGTTERDRQLTAFAVTNICGELINRDFTGYAFESRPGEYACLLQFRNTGADEEKLYPLFVEVREKLRECLRIETTIGVGPVVSGLGNVPKSYAGACGNVSRRLFLGRNRIIIDSLDFDEESGGGFDLAKMDRIADLLKNGDEGQMKSAVGSFFRDLAHCRGADTQYCLNVSYQMILTARRKLMELNIFPRNICRDESTVCGELFRLETLEEMQGFVTRWMTSQIRAIEEKRSSRSHGLIDRIREIVERRYSENLSIKDISREVYLSPSYLSMVFKQETGDTINDYITKVRVEHAKAMLKNPGARLCDISRDVGYAEPGYFSRIFKRMTGSNPSEYRQALQ